MYRIKILFQRIILIISGGLHKLSLLIIAVPVIAAVCQRAGLSGGRLLYYIFTADGRLRGVVGIFLPPSLQYEWLSRIIIILIGFFLRSIFAYTSNNACYNIEVYQKKLATLLLRKKLTKSPPVYNPAPRPLEAEEEETHGGFISRVKDLLGYSEKSELKRLLTTLARTKRRLEKWSKDLAFLSFDIEGSASMKEGEDPSIVNYDFSEFKKFVSQILSKHRCIKSTWTPDGAMCCFQNFDQAFSAAKDIIYGLDEFNRDVKTIKKDFRIRCGINSGSVYFENALPLEEITGRTIDIAGHLQKNAEPSSIYATSHSIYPAELRNYFVKIDNLIDGCEVMKWER